MVKLTINGKEIEVKEGVTVLRAAEQAGFTIPTLCDHKDLTPYGGCRLCMVEVQGFRGPTASCTLPVSPGMVVTTESPALQRSRRTILELLDSTVDLSDAPEIQQMMIDYQAMPDRFPGAVARSPQPIDDNPMYLRDYAKCVLCWRCVQVCAEDAQYAFAINFSGRGYETQVSTFFDIPMPESTCVFCGQCVGVCPTGALKPKREWLLEEGRTPDDIMSLTRSQRRSRRRAAPNFAEQA
jgi:NADH dehydrogenase/NADH:ubiquinone oxidoreductase subunit G